MKKKIAIIGASYLQKPLVTVANDIGIETHVFAWEEGNVVNDIADFFYPISILDKEEILKKCKEIGINGITSIASDIAMPTVNYVAEKLNLIGNSVEATLKSTDKYEMRKALRDNNISCPKFSFYDKPSFSNKEGFDFPVIVKPTDRSGSRGVTKVELASGVNDAIEKALKHSINKRVIVESFIENTREFSVEMISFKGKHYPLAITDKVITGSPYFVEIAHHQPADINDLQKNNITETVLEALDALDVKNGASHSEVFLTKDGNVKIVEIAMRMGGDLIGSHLVKLSTGYDFVKGVINVAMNNFEAVEYSGFKNEYAGSYYVLPGSGKVLKVENNASNYSYIVEAIPLKKEGDYISQIIDGADKRAGIFVYHSTNTRLDIDPNKILKFSFYDE